VRGFPAFAGIHKAHLAPGETEKGIVLDDLRIIARRGDAVAEENASIAVAQGEITAECRATQESQDEKFHGGNYGTRRQPFAKPRVANVTS
jgi:hypothetical protein